MDAKVAIALGSVYGGIYYFMARRLLFRLRGVDKNYYIYLGAQGGVGFSNSAAIIAMIFDTGTPKECWPIHIKRRLALVRGMLAVSPLVFIGIFLVL